MRSRRLAACRAVALVATMGTLCLAGPAAAQDIPEPPAVPELPALPDPATLTAELQELVAEIQADPASAATIIQGYATGKVGEAVSGNLGTALGLLQTVTAPVCPTLGTVSKLLPLRLNLNYPVGSPVGALDHQTSEGLYQNYKTLFSTVLAPLALPGALAEPLAPATGLVGVVQTLLGTVLKVNYHTVYHPPGGGPAIVRDTPGFLGFPMVLDVDGQVGPGGYELCANTSMNLATGAVTQQISRMPLARATLPVDVRAEYLLGLVRTGYETNGSNAPYRYATTTTTDATTMNSTLEGAGPAFAQVGGLGISLGSLSLELEHRLGFTKPPARWSFAATHPGRDASQPTSQQAKGLKTTFSSSGGGTLDHSVKLVLGPLVTGGGTTYTPAPAYAEWCNSSKGYCSNEPAIDPETLAASTSLTASQAVQLDQHPIGSAPTTCSAVSTAAADTVPGGSSHFTARRLTYAQRTGANGQAWIDTDGEAATGCVASNSTTGTLPAGFSAQDRRVTWDGAGLPTSKTGTIACPVGTVLTGGSLGISFGLSRYLCDAAPVNVVLPSITATSTSNRSRSLGTWYPSLTSAIQTTSATQWLRCDAVGDGCVPIAGATGSTYTRTVADAGMTNRVDVTVTNPYGSATARSAPVG